MNNPTIKSLKHQDNGPAGGYAFQSELMRLTNLKTGNNRYYVSKCDVMTRVSYEDYTERYDSADGFSSHHSTKTKHISGNTLQRFMIGVRCFKSAKELRPLMRAFLRLTSGQRTTSFDVIQTIQRTMHWTMGHIRFTQ
jgi:hypothetical protein